MFRFFILPFAFFLLFRSLRYTGASWLAQQSVSLLEIQKILGHSSPVVTAIYAHLAGRNLLAAVEKISTELIPLMDRYSRKFFAPQQPGGSPST